MELYISPQGQVRCIYAEDIDLSVLGRVSIARASHVEPDETGQWWADLAPVHGPKLGPFDRRTLALEAEIRWLDVHLSDLVPVPSPFYQVTQEIGLGEGLARDRGVTGQPWRVP